MANGTELIPALLLALIMTLAGSLAKYSLTKHSEKVPDPGVPFLSHVAVSLFAGMMMCLLGLTNGWSLYVVGIGCGWAGWQGASVIKQIRPPGFGPDNGEENER